MTGITKMSVDRGAPGRHAEQRPGLSPGLRRLLPFAIAAGVGLWCLAGLAGRPMKLHPELHPEDARRWAERRTEAPSTWTRSIAEQLPAQLDDVDEVTAGAVDALRLARENAAPTAREEAALRLYVAIIAEDIKAGRSITAVEGQLLLDRIDRLSTQLEVA